MQRFLITVNQGQGARRRLAQFLRRLLNLPETVVGVDGFDDEGGIGEA